MNKIERNPKIVRKRFQGARPWHNGGNFPLVSGKDGAWEMPVRMNSSALVETVDLFSYTIKGKVKLGEEIHPSKDTRKPVASGSARCSSKLPGTLWTPAGVLGWEEWQEASSSYFPFPGFGPSTAKVQVRLNHCHSIVRFLPRSTRKGYCQRPSRRETGDIWLKETHQLTPRESSEEPEGVAWSLASEGWPQWFECKME